MAGNTAPTAPRRLAALARLVPRGSRVADIGTDHALLPEILLRSGRASHCIATEIHPPRYRRVRSRLESGPLASRFEFRVGDGLSVLKPEDRLDVLVLAGMGTETVCSILSDPPFERLGVRRLVIQPQTEPARLRRWLVMGGVRIVEESLLDEGRRFRLLLAAEPGHDRAIDPHPSLPFEDVLEAGPCLVRSGDPSVARYWNEQLRRNRRIVDRATDGPARDEARRMLALAERVLAVLPDPETRGRNTCGI